MPRGNIENEVETRSEQSRGQEDRVCNCQISDELL